jgi:2-polyprenyl-3-methyl-5-hydroxy-6-metoxy-1,4-benzoquinol methylase
MDRISPEKINFDTEDLTEKHMKEMEKHQGFNQSNIAEHYDDLCTNYESIYLKVGFPCPRKCAEMTESCFTELRKENKQDAEVLDLGCGTGLVAKYLAELGYNKIDGVDAS